MRRSAASADCCHEPETRLGTLDFEDGAPSNATPDKVYDSLDFARAFRAFADACRTTREPGPLRLFLVESASGEGVA